jgi:hypothetical protein
LHAGFKSTCKPLKRELENFWGGDTVGAPHFASLGAIGPQEQGGYRDITTITMTSMKAATSANWNINTLLCSGFIVLFA